MEQKHIEPHLTGQEAEDFVEFFSGKTFLKPWVFRSPKFTSDNKELTDVAVYFRDILILIQVKGNKFDPKNPQRYLAEAESRHVQLKRSERIVRGQSKTTRFTNDYFSFETNFKDVQKIYLISISTGPGEMELAAGGPHIDYSRINYADVAKYLGFYNSEDNIHSFTGEEIIFASKHVDTLRDFLWYLDFEKKFLSNDFKKKKEKQGIIAMVDAHREDLISLYILYYYWDENLNMTGEIDLNKILGDADLEKADMVMYAGTDARNHLEDDEGYKKIKKEKEISYFWDNLIEYVFSEYHGAYKLVGDKMEKVPSRIEELKSILEEMSFTSRLERVLFSEGIDECDKKDLVFRNMMSKSPEAKTLFSYARVKYKEFPTPQEQSERVHQHLYSVWCRIQFGEGIRPMKEKIKNTLLITKHSHKHLSSFSFALSPEIKVDEKICRDVGVI